MLAHFLSGSVTVEEFLANYWQKRCLHVKGGDPTRLEGIFSIYEMEELWSSTMRGMSLAAEGGVEGPGGVLVFTGTGVQAKRRMSPFYAFAARCSVVVNRGDAYSQHLYQICTTLQDEYPNFPFACCNVYLTPPGSQTVPRHSDDRDVFLLQIHGAKRWTVYNDPVRLPYRDEELGKDKPIPDGALSEPEICEVRRGDVLYMPRGVVHEGTALDDCSSLHLTIALQTSDWDYASVLLAVVKKALRTPPLAASRVCCPLQSIAVVGPSNNKAADDEAASILRQLLDGVQSHTFLNDNFATAREVFQQKMKVMHADRDAFIEVVQVPVPCPLLLSSLIMWNPTMDVAGIETTPDAEKDGERDDEPLDMPWVSTVVHCVRKLKHGGEQQLKFRVSDEMLRSVLMLSKHHNVAPVQVKALPMFDDLSRLSLANVLINNTCCIRVS